MSRKCTGKCGRFRVFFGCNCHRMGFLSEEDGSKDDGNKATGETTKEDFSATPALQPEVSGSSSAMSLEHYFLFIHSMPFHDGLKAFDVMQEEKRIKDAIADAKVRMRFESMLGTNRNITSLGNDRVPSILHFVGHGRRADSMSQNVLIIESDASEYRELHSADLAKILGPTCPIRLVFVATCYSDAMGQMFADAGVRHVVATTGEIDNKRAECFVEMFYKMLFQGQSVRRAFDLAVMFQKTEVLQLPGADAFVLLPRDESVVNNIHDEVMLSAIHRGRMIDVSTRFCTIFKCGQLTDSAIIRSNYISQIHKLFFEKKRLVTVYGERGNGSSHVATMACRYMFHRPLFGAIVHIHFRRQLLGSRSGGLHPSVSGKSVVSSEPLGGAGVSAHDSVKRGGSGGTTSSGSSDSQDPDTDVMFNEALDVIYKAVHKAFGINKDTSRRATLSAIVDRLNNVGTSLSQQTSTTTTIDNRSRILLFLDDCDAYLSVKESPVAINKSKSDSKLVSVLSTGSGTSPHESLSTTPPAAKHNSLSIMPFLSTTAAGASQARVSFDSATTFSRTSLLGNSGTSMTTTVEGIQNLVNGTNNAKASSKNNSGMAFNNSKPMERSISVGATEGFSSLTATPPSSPSPRAEKVITGMPDDNPLYRVINHIYRECPHVSFILSHSARVKLVPTATKSHVKFIEHLVNVSPLNQMETGLLLNRL
jgi:hypothetical protein